MCKILEDLRNESLKEGAKGAKNETALRMLKAGKYTLEEIAEMAVLPLDEVKRLQAGQEI
ncbi:MAG: hypothetical protein HFJ86_09490 [Oscillospiraceae bacterium]|jgi:hypothetical protein|nr:hypothetical protein [Oscillospiraceae bacterium]